MDVSSVTLGMRQSRWCSACSPKPEWRWRTAMDTPAFPLSLVEDSRPNVWQGNPQEMEVVRCRARGRPGSPPPDQQGKNKDMARLFSQHGPGWFSWSVSAAVPEGHPTALRRADAQRSNCGPCAVSSVAITYSVPYQQGRNKDTA